MWLPWQPREPRSVVWQPCQSTSWSVYAVIDGYCCKPISINSDFHQGSDLSPTLFVLFINDPLSITESPIHSYADDSTLQYSITFKSLPSQIELHDALVDATERLASDPSIISDWGRRNLVSFNASKTQFLHLSIRLSEININYPPDVTWITGGRGIVKC